MGNARKMDQVRCWEEEVIIPTYPVQEADPNPMFLEKRVYQGSSGKVYPNPFTDQVALQKRDQTYRAIMLENEFIQLMILPEVGGRIHVGKDKTNQYDFFYRQRVIKPALVGLLGPWISGGVEFNWPQHHRPSTCMAVHASIEEHADGSCTVWLSEHDPMLRMKGMVGVSLAPGKAIVEAKIRLYNRTPLPQTFLWWANVAVRVNERYQAFFPPDVTFVADHAKRAISSFPVARNSYYGVDYRPGTDISWYKNIPVPTSYMVTKSKYDFFGGYDHARQAGVVHTSNHHVAPGKKLWTWGNAEFGYAWDRNLTDEDGPYVELMAGAYTDNQPDFSWLQPYETKTFSQFWYPIQKIGPAKNANTEAAVNLEFEKGSARIGVHATSRRTVRAILTCNGRIVFDEQHDLSPGVPLVEQVRTEDASPEKHILLIQDAEGNAIICYQPERNVDCEPPALASEPPEPKEIDSIEELYLTGLHLEQYRHATRLPEAYWLEGLEREPNDARLNNAFGLRCFRRGEFAKAELHFQRAARRLQTQNPNPYDGEPFYNLGLARLYQGKTAEANDAFYKSVWNYAWQSAGNYTLASIASARGELSRALELVTQSLLTNVQNLKARALKASVLRRLGWTVEAQAIIDETLALDRLDFRMMAELFLIGRNNTNVERFEKALEADVQSLLDVIFDISWSGSQEDAFLLLRACADTGKWIYPMVWYTLAWLASALRKNALAAEYLERAEESPSRYCFPARLEEMIVLEWAVKRNPNASKAHYYLGNLYYDMRRYEDAIRCWRHSVELDDTFSIPLRNLGIAEFNVHRDPIAANLMYERAFRANPADARLLYEWDQLKKRAGNPSPAERLQFLNQFQPLVEQRDDLFLEYAALLNQTGDPEAALARIQRRRFSPWEGGEGLVSTQYVRAHRVLGRAALLQARYRDALNHFESARHYPQNLGEGKHLLALERDLDYLSGLAARELGDGELVQRYWRAAAVPLAQACTHTYFRARALVALGDEVSAREALAELWRASDQALTATAKIDYFATSLPNLLLFDDDLAKRSRNEATILKALAHDGFRERDRAIELLQQALAVDPNLLFALEMVDWMKQKGAAEIEGSEARSVS